MNAMCIIFSDAFNNERIGELTVKRNLASVPFGGRYRLIDFMLSSLVNARVPNIGVVTRSNYSSLMDHLGSGKDWDLNRKNEGLKFLTPFILASEKTIKNKFDALMNIKTYIRHTLQDYCILSDSNIVGNIDFKSVLKTHIEKGADITCLYHSAEVRNGELTIKVNERGHVDDVLYHTETGNQKEDVVVKIYVLKKSLLLELIDRGITFGWNDLDSDFISRNFKEYKIFAYKITSYCKVIHDINDYYNTNIELLNKEIRDELLKSDTPILTKVKDSVPTMYAENANVSNSLIADGCKIDGTVQNSIIFRGTVIKKGAVVSNCVIMQNSTIGENCVLTNVISDKEISISSDKVLTGYESLPFVISKGTKI